jgi:MFS family permease
MVGAVFYGILFEKVSKNKLLFTMFGLTMIGCFLMNFAPNPTSGFTFAIMAILGSGMSGLYTGALYFINKYAYTEFRGYLIYYM